jgi:ParB family transcriptional regulator, chromosome partitioning protein
LMDRFDYTHAQVAKVIGKSRTSVTETLSLNHIPADIREKCRHADITSKSLLLQIVRQPDFDSMKKLVDRIARENLTREQVREEKSSAKKKKNFSFHSSGTNFNLIINFNKLDVSNDEVVSALEDTLSKLK